MGYCNQVPMAEEDVEKTAFTTQMGSYEWLMMPQRLQNSPSQYHRRMQRALGHLPFVRIFIDDVVLFTVKGGVQEHYENVRNFLQTCPEKGVYLKASKAQMLKESLKFLGHTLSSEGCRPQHGKVAAVRDWPALENATHVRQFLGLTVHYRRFIHCFSDIAPALTMLTKNDVEWKWGPEQQWAFEELKAALVDAPVLALPNLRRLRIPTIDDSEAKQLLKVVVDKLRVLEHFIKKIPEGRCAKVDKGVLCHAYKDCPRGGGRPGAHAFCCPAAKHDEEDMRALALCHVYQQAAGDGPVAFSQVCEVHGAPEVLRAGGSTADVDLSMYGFAVGGAAGSLSPSGRCFGPECAWGMPRSGADASSLQVAAVKLPGPDGPLYPHFSTEVAIDAMSVAEQVESESSDDEAAEVQARPREQVDCGRPPFGIEPKHDCGLSAADTIEKNNNFNIQADPAICHGQVCMYPGIDTLSAAMSQQVLQVFSPAGVPASTYGGVDTGDTLTDFTCHEAVIFFDA
eukprot:gene34237-biopygen21961